MRGHFGRSSPTPRGRTYLRDLDCPVSFVNEDVRTDLAGGGSAGGRGHSGSEIVLATRLKRMHGVSRACTAHWQGLTRAQTVEIRGVEVLSD